MVESEDERKNLLMRVKDESEKSGLKFNIPKTKIIASRSVTSWQIEGEKVEAVINFIFLGCKITESLYFVVKIFQTFTYGILLILL